MNAGVYCVFVTDYSPNPVIEDYFLTPELSDRAMLVELSDGAIDLVRQPQGSVANTKSIEHCEQTMAATRSLRKSLRYALEDDFLSCIVEVSEILINIVAS